MMSKERAMKDWQEKYAQLLETASEDQREKTLLQEQNRFLQQKNNNLEQQLQKEREVLEKVMRTS